MKIADFIKANRDAIEEHVRERGGKGSKSIEDLKAWIQNDEYLYSWARACGVRV